MVNSLRVQDVRPRHCLVCGAALPPTPFGAAGSVPCSHCGSLLSFTEGPEGRVATLRLGEKMVTSESLQRLLDWARTHADEPLFIDFQNATFLTSAALGDLISLKKLLRHNLSFRNLQPDLLEVFRVTHLGSFFNLGKS